MAMLKKRLTLELPLKVQLVQLGGFPGGLVIKKPLPRQETWVWSLGQEDPLEQEMATHSSTLAWEIPWTEEAGGLLSSGLQKSQMQLSD